jgi:hypothetical protein
MVYYHIDLATNKIVAGPFSPSDLYVRQATSCGNPELLNLSDYGFLPSDEVTSSDDDDYGDPVISGTVVVRPKAQPTLAEVRRRKRERVNEICANRLDGAITVGGEVYDTAQRAVVLELLAHAERNPTVPTVVLRKNGVPVALTLAQMRALATAMGARTAACFANAKALYDAIRTATRAELRAMDLRAGWPE